MMKLWTIGLIAFAIAILCASVNVLSGFALTNRIESAAEGHLIRGIAACVFSFTGHILCLLASDRATQKLREKWAEETSPNRGDLLRQSQELAHLWSWLAAGAVVPSLITGTVAQPGSFPVVHGVLGFAFIVAGVVAIAFWLRYILKLRALLTAF
jgi:hypothetical protein